MVLDPLWTKGLALSGAVAGIMWRTRNRDVDFISTALWGEPPTLTIEPPDCFSELLHKASWVRVDVTGSKLFMCISPSLHSGCGVTFSLRRELAGPLRTG